MISAFDNEPCIDESDLEDVNYLPNPPQKNLSSSIKQVCQDALKNGKEIMITDTLDTIAERLEISTDVLKQRLYKNLLKTNNGQKRLTRDWVIAICFAYGFNDEETDNVIAYCGFASFDGARVRRDELIQRYLRWNANQDKPCHIEEFQTFLSGKGIDTLELEKRKRKNDKVRKNVACQFPVSIDSPYKKAGPIKLRTYGLDIEPYDDITREYYPGLSCAALVPVEDDASNRIFLKATCNGTCYLCRESDDMELSYDAIEKVPTDFRGIFDELLNLARKEKQRLDDLCNDTRNFNYGSRYGINLKGERIHIFYEQYNYLYPYRNEYFLVEYCAGQFTYSVARKSMFLEEYLSPDEYYKHYHTKDRVKRKIYKSIEDFDSERQSVKKDSYLEEIYFNRRQRFQELHNDVQNLLKKLQNGDYIIREDYFHEDCLGLIDYYGLDEQFVEDNDDDIIIKSDAEIAMENGGSINLTYEDLEEAFRLGINDVADICRIKLKLGSVSKSI